MTAGNQIQDVAYERMTQAESVWENGKPQRRSVCAEEHRYWMELICWMEKLGLTDAGWGKKVDSFLQETEEIIRKTELLIAQRTAFVSSMKQRLYQEQ